MENCQKRTPSRIDNVSEEEEVTHRVFGCDLIQETGIYLGQPQVVMVTGQTILHKFYQRLVEIAI